MAATARILCISAPFSKAPESEDFVVTDGSSAVTSGMPAAGTMMLSKKMMIPNVRCQLQMGCVAGPACSLIVFFLCLGSSGPWGCSE